MAKLDTVRVVIDADVVVSKLSKIPLVEVDKIVETSSVFRMREILELPPFPVGIVVDGLGILGEVDSMGSGSLDDKVTLGTPLQGG